jgi:hypothetical protein
MILQFSDSRITEFANGNFYRKNDGAPFEVKDILGNDLLKAPTVLDGQKVKVFKKFEKKVSKSFLPEDFPMRDELEQNDIFTLEQVNALELDDHSRLKSIGKKSMQKILDARIVGEQSAPPSTEILTEGNEGE